MDKPYTLIHTALLCEAQTFIEKLKLKKINSTPKIYANDSILMLIGGVGKDNTQNSLEYIFKNYSIKKAINIGVVGCNDKTIPIGDLFCTNQNIDHIKNLPLVTSDLPTLNTSLKNSILFDMEGKYFYKVCENYLKKQDIYIFKVVSDHLDVKSLNKEFVKKLIFQNYSTLYTAIV